MMMTISVVFSLLLATLFAGPVRAQELIVYPAKGQSQQQMEQDKFTCHSWAKKQTGFDPMEVPKATASPPPKQPQKRGLFRGAARGAAVGVADGANAGDADKGVLIGGMRRRVRVARQQKAEQQWAQEQAAPYTQKLNEYNRAYAACLEGKGYTVK